MPVRFNELILVRFPPAGNVKFIDYEYAGYNYQAFDIGNHFNEFAGNAISFEKPVVQDGMTSP